MPKKHYQHDDRVYRRLESEGKTSWDQNADPAASFDKFLLRPFLEETLHTLGQQRQGRTALEIGCGTGPVSCFLAKEGFSVDGIDISATAIAMARRQAATRGLAVHFIIADICNMPSGFGPYDLIVDGHCLHCLAADALRHKALATIRTVLKDSGLFIVEMMVRHEHLRIGQQYHLDDNGILWLKIDNPQDYDEAAQFAGQWYLPHRTILRPDQILAELRQNRFTPVHHAIVPQKDPAKPHLMRIRCVPTTDPHP